MALDLYVATTYEIGKVAANDTVARIANAGRGLLDPAVPDNAGDFG